MNNIIKISNLKKSFGEIKAINNISLNVEKGEMFGLVGPDGAGKTTTIKCLCGLTNPDSGNLNLLNLDIKSNKKSLQNRIGYLSQKFSLYEDLTIDENIEFFAEIHNIKDYHELRNELLTFTNLIKFRDRQAGKLSGGMKQKLALACSLIHKPEILFLDEPTTGVDPVSRRDFWKILANLLKDGITIFMTTPYLDEAERCSRIALMNKGEIMVVNTPNNIKQSVNKNSFELITDDIRETAKLIKSELGYKVQLFGDRLNILLDDDDSNLKTIRDLLQKNNIKITGERINIPSLENVFIHLVSN